MTPRDEYGDIMSSIDDRKMRAAIDLVTAWQDLRQAIDDHGALSEDARVARDIAERALRRFRRLQRT